MVRVGIVGAGLIGHSHAFMLTRCREPHDLIGVFDTDTVRCEKFASDWGIGAFGSLDDLLAVTDAVFVCTWTSAHLEVVDAASRQGHAIFCEKPLGTDLASARVVASTISGAGVVEQVGLVLRSLPAFLALRELIRDRDVVGRVMNVVFRDDQYIPIQGLYASTWRADVERAGSGALLEHSIHDVDLLEWLVGPIRSVTARTAEFHHIAGIEDSVAALIGFDDGVSATLNSIWHDIGARPSLRRMEVFCERALITLESDAGPVRCQSDRGEVVLEGEGIDTWLASVGVEVEVAEDRFLRAVRTAGRTTPTSADALRAHVVVDALYRSAAGGGTTVTLADGAW